MQFIALPIVGSAITLLCLQCAELMSTSIQAGGATAHIAYDVSDALELRLSRLFSSAAPSTTLTLHFSIQALGRTADKALYSAKTGVRNMSAITN